MIIGIGTDLLHIPRMVDSYNSQPNIAERVLTVNELNIFDSKLPNSTLAMNYLAKRFAAKEAAAKALGTGIGRGVSFQHMEVHNDEFGCPKLSFSSGALSRIQQLSSGKPHRAWISLSDEKDFALAYVVIVSIDDQ